MPKKRKGKSIASNHFEFHELITRVLCDTAPPRKVDVMYLFSETSDNEASVLQAGASLYLAGAAKKLAISSLGKAYGYPGEKKWLKKLLTMGVPRKNIDAIPMAGDFPPCTDAEALGIVRYAKNKNWKSLYIVAPPLHQLRVFITTVSHVMKEKSNLKVYSYPGIPQKWEERIVHSQGIQKGTRSKLLAKELEKIQKYYQEGDLVSGERVLKYLNKRDRGSA